MLFFLDRLARRRLVAGDTSSSSSPPQRSTLLWLFLRLVVADRVVRRVVLLFVLFVLLNLVSPKGFNQDFGVVVVAVVVVRTVLCDGATPRDVCFGCWTCSSLVGSKRQLSSVGAATFCRGLFACGRRPMRRRRDLLGSFVFFMLLLLFASRATLR